jgi:hypothetical protein
LTLAALGALCSSAAPAWAADGRKVDRQHRQRTPFFATALGQRMPRFVRHRLARRHLCKTLPAFKAEYKSALSKERRNWERNVFQVASNLVVTVSAVPYLGSLAILAQTKPLWAGIGAVMLAVPWGFFNWLYSAERTIRAADAAVDTLPWKLKLTYPQEMDPQETACDLIREVGRNF